VRTRLTLLHQALCKEMLQQRSKAGGRGHGRSSQRCSSRRIASRIRRAAQIPLRIRDVDMAKVGGQDRQAALWILTGLIPVDERSGRKYVPHVVETWPVTVGYAAQADPPG